MLELVLGGARSGKSRFAMSAANESGLRLVYLATAEGKDEEMSERIQQHKAERSERWLVIEEPIYLADTLERHAAEDTCIVVDCLTLWLANLLALSSESFLEQKNALISVAPRLKGKVIFVNNTVGMGIVPLGELSRRFVDESGWLEQALAKVCSRVTFIAAGLPLVLKEP